MIKGLYSAAATMVAQLMRQQVIANNLANVTTPGFKADRSVLRNFPRQVVPNDGLTLVGLLSGVGTGPKGDLGTGVLADPPVTDFGQGALRMTGRDLDFALVGPGFFSVRTPNGIMYTRAGNFGRNGLGQLVTYQGDLVLGVDGGPIAVGSGPVSVRSDGTVVADEQPVGQLAIVDFADPKQLEKVGNNLFTTKAAPAARPAETAVQNGAIEGANVDLTQNMTDSLAARRLYEASQRVLQMQDQMLDRAVNEVGRLGR